MTRLQDEDYVDIDVTNDPAQEQPDEPLDVFHDKCVEQASGRHSLPDLTIPHALRKLYPAHSLVMSDDPRLNLLSFSEAQIEQIPSSIEVKSTVFAGDPRRLGGAVTGRLVHRVVCGSYKMTWKEKEFIVHVVKVPQEMMGTRTIHFFLHSGGEEPVRDLLLSAMLGLERLHDEIWVFDDGFWDKDKSLFSNVQDSSWDDIIKKDSCKEALKKDLHGFFDAEGLYKRLSIPWKRGLIMYGPPGNGKTITVKAVIKTCTERGFIPLYVKSFSCCRGDQVAMMDVFKKARQMSPCVLILEDLDSLINDINRSYFLNQLDGLEGNDGVLIIGTTNHLEKLNPALSNRPSRFDRKYHFDDPDKEERAMYAKHWQNKLKDKEVSFPDSLVEEVASITAGFSFAYLKEAFVSALFGSVHASEGDKIEFGDVLKNQITTLQEELGIKRQENSSDNAAMPSFASILNTETNAVASTTQPEMVIPGSLSTGLSWSSKKVSPDPFHVKSYTPDVPTASTPWSLNTTRTARDSPNRPEPNPPAVVKIKLDGRAEPSRDKVSQTPALLAAPTGAYPKAVKSMPGTLPVLEPFSFTAPKQL